MGVCYTFNHLTAQLIKLPETQAYIYYEFLSAKIPVFCLIVGAFGILQRSSVVILCIFIWKKFMPSGNTDFIETSNLNQTWYYIK